MGALSMCSKVAQTISECPFTLPTTCMPTKASCTSFVPFGVNFLFNASGV